MLGGVELSGGDEREMRSDKEEKKKEPQRSEREEDEFPRVETKV